jgi:hypothetical protein
VSTAMTARGIEARTQRERTIEASDVVAVYQPAG